MSRMGPDFRDGRRNVGCDVQKGYPRTVEPSGSGDWWRRGKEKAVGVRDIRGFASVAVDCAFLNPDAGANVRTVDHIPLDVRSKRLKPSFEVCRQVEVVLDL